MIRVWNFNRNRVHADRGVRNIVIEIDSKVSSPPAEKVPNFNFSPVLPAKSQKPVGPFNPACHGVIIFSLQKMVKF